MIDLPEGFPMYCRDLKQTLDEKWEYLNGNKVNPIYKDYRGTCYQSVRDLPNYPKQLNEHNALDDARWNFELYKFLQEL